MLSNEVIGRGIMDECSPATLIHLSQTCTLAYSIVNNYIRLAFNINHLLRPYFRDSTASFRQLQVWTGLLISGSTALQLFLRTRFPSSDLDVYVHRRSRVRVGQWLLSHDYTFEPHQGQPDDFSLAAEQPIIDTVTARYSRMYGVAAVFTFQNHDQKKVQVIATVHSPMAVILMYHSSTWASVV